MSDLRLLTVMAHPDDETFGLGGTLALYAQQGVQVYLVCATRGEVGTVEPRFMEGYDTIAELREAELRCAADKLGLTELYFMGYRDSGMQGTADNQNPAALAQADPEKVVAEVVGHMRRLRPQVVVTFDPEGGYGHPDHIAIHNATVEAFHAAGDPNRYPDQGQPFSPQKLYYQTFSRRYLRVVINLSKLLGQDPTRWGKNQDMDLTQLAIDRYPITAKVNYRKVVEQKRQASACHASQLDMGPSSHGLMGLVSRVFRSGNVDTFMRAHPPVGNGRVEHDLFAGVA